VWEVRIVFEGQDPEADGAEVCQLLFRLAMGSVKQRTQEGKCLLGRQFTAGRREESAPEGPGRPLVAVAEDCPARAALVI
jgi:hypothetical protein